MIITIRETVVTVSGSTMLSSAPLKVRPNPSSSYSNLAVWFVKDCPSGFGMVLPP